MEKVSQSHTPNRCVLRKEPGSRLPVVVERFTLARQETTSNLRLSPAEFRDLEIRTRIEEGLR